MSKEHYYSSRGSLLGMPILFFLLSIFIPPTSLLCQYYSGPRQEWVATFNVWPEDIARAITVDNQRNVYVTGQTLSQDTSIDYVTVKYDSQGNELWVAIYNGPDNYGDVAIDIVVDGSGNSYVTGTSYCLDTKNDFLTIKYDQSGNELWVARFSLSDDSNEAAHAVALDDSGCVYVSGLGGTVKYDNDGNQLWAVGPLGRCYDNAIDPDGNLLVVVEWLYIYAHVYKYDREGNLIWFRGFAGGDEARPAKVITDMEGNIYITGYEWDWEMGRNYFTVKYDPDGTALWFNRYRGPDSAKPSDIGVDRDGNVYVTGLQETRHNGDNYCTVKYDNDGNFIWVREYDGPVSGGDRATNLALDKSGNIFVTGYSNRSDNTDYTTIKYSPTGKILWTGSYNGPDNDTEITAGLFLDERGNIYVTGRSYGLNHAGDEDIDFATVKYSPPPHHKVLYTE